MRRIDAAARRRAATACAAILAAPWLAGTALAADCERASFVVAVDPGHSLDHGFIACDLFRPGSAEGHICELAFSVHAFPLVL